VGTAAWSGRDQQHFKHLYESHDSAAHCPWPLDQKGRITGTVHLYPHHNVTRQGWRSAPRASIIKLRKVIEDMADRHPKKPWEAWACAHELLDAYVTLFREAGWTIHPWLSVSIVIGGRTVAMLRPGD
jgi:hypothetical protein